MKHLKHKRAVLAVLALLSLAGSFQPLGAYERGYFDSFLLALLLSLVCLFLFACSPFGRKPWTSSWKEKAPREAEASTEHTRKISHLQYRQNTGGCQAMMTEPRYLRPPEENERANEMARAYDQDSRRLPTCGSSLTHWRMRWRTPHCLTRRYIRA